MKKLTLRLKTTALQASYHNMLQAHHQALLNHQAHQTVLQSLAHLNLNQVHLKQHQQAKKRQQLSQALMSNKLDQTLKLQYN